MQPTPNLLCPLCGGPNHCAPARSGSFASPCWCRSDAVTIDPGALARVPEAMRGMACLCARCAGVSTAPSAD